jgi:hypothetical protein
MKGPSQYFSHRRSSDDEDEEDRKPAAKLRSSHEADATENADDGPQSGATSLASSTAAITEYSCDRGKAGWNPSRSGISLRKSSSTTSQVGSNPSRNASPTNAAAATVRADQSAVGRSVLVRLQWTVTLYLLSTVLAWSVFVCHILPTEAVWALFWIIISTGLMFQTLHATFRQWYRDVVVVGPGLGAFIPESLLRTMTQTTLHEMLTDETLVLEYRHLLLYFLPLSNEQLYVMLQRLAPQHRQRLYRRGAIGQMMLGEAFMRVLLGNAQYDQWRQLEPELDNGMGSTGATYSTPRESTVVVPATAPTIPAQTYLLSDDEGSDLGLDVSSEDLIGGNQAMAQRLGLFDTRPSPASHVAEADFVSTRPPQEVVTTVSRNAHDDYDDMNRYNDQEFQVLVDAMIEAVYGFVVNPVQAYVTSSFMLPAMQTASRHSLRTGIALLTFSTGNLIGLWTWSYAILFNLIESTRFRVPMIPRLPPSLRPSPHSQREGVVTPWTPLGDHWALHPSTATWSTALLGSASIGISYYSRQWVRRHMATLQSSGNSNGNLSPPKPGTKSLSKVNGSQ